jgi:hypothetical protein
VNRAELVARMNQASSELLRQKGFISFVDILIHMGKLTREDYESWRMRRIPYLERAIRLNLSQLNHLRRTVRQNAVKGRLQPRKTAYVSRGRVANYRSGSANRDIQRSKRPMQLILCNARRV